MLQHYAVSFYRRAQPVSVSMTESKKCAGYGHENVVKLGRGHHSLVGENSRAKR